MGTVCRELADESATRALGAALARVLRAGDIVALDGPLGAGKTTLVRAIATALGVDERLVSSPTFVFVNQYPIPETSRNGALAGGHLVHMDAYRLSSAEDLDSLGWDRLFDPETRGAAGRAAALVEWPSRVAGAFSGAAVLRMEPTGVTSRRVTLDVPPSWNDREGFATLLGHGAA